MHERLYRSRDDRMIAGVAGGLAERLGTDPSLVRIVWALLIIATGGVALAVYVVMAIVVPNEEDLFPPFANGAPYSPFGAPPTVDPRAGAPGSAPGGAPPTGTFVPPVPPPPLTGAYPVPPPQPMTRDQWRAQRRAARQSGEGRMASTVIVGTALILIGAWFLVREYVPELEPARFWPFALVGLGIVVLVAALSRRSDVPGGDRR